MSPRRAVVLVDGEHYPPVTASALDALAATGTSPVAALVLGGVEKVGGHEADLGLSVPVTWVRGEGVPAMAGALTSLCADLRPDVVYDLSDEPVLDARDRLRLASNVLVAGVPYETADLRLDPPPRPRLAFRPSIAVIGTGKRTGKTSVAAAITRHLMAVGRTPVVTAMGRGGPARPVVLPAGTTVDLDRLLAVADAGEHAASDCYEDAVMTGAATVGARRCGGGLAGAVAHSTVAEAVAAAGRQPGDVDVFEGSGAAIPPVHADATVLVVPADADPELLGGYLGSFRVLLADQVVVTMAAPPRSSAAMVERTLEVLGSISRRTPVLLTVFRPVPLGSVAGERVLFATTAPGAVAASLIASLEARFGCEVVATSSQLADRDALRADMAAAPAFDVLLVELKAAAVDVAARNAAHVGARVVFCDNRPHVVNADGEEATATLADSVARLLDLADRRFVSP
jgi:cyclic 2,3-diphosphoglycerate synthase